MNKNLRNVAVLAATATGLLPATPAQAQYDGGAYVQPAPLYPYAVRGERPYAIEVAPNTYEIRRSAPTRAYPYVRGQASNSAAEQKAPAFDRPHKPADRGSIEELRKRSPAKRTVINTKKIVHDKPVVIETERVVDDPPRVIERLHVVEDEPVRAPRKHAAPQRRDSNTGMNGDDGKKCVIQADAEVTILGPDRISIRLFRKGQGPKSNARAE